MPGVPNSKSWQDLEAVPKRGSKSVIRLNQLVKLRCLWYTLRIMSEEDAYLMLGGAFLIGAGLGFYLARIIFGA